MVRFHPAFGWFAGSVLVVGIGGCAGNILPSDSLAQVLQKLTQTASSKPILNQLTVGDVVTGFKRFASQFEAGAASPASTEPASAQPASAQPVLTADEQSQLQSLQSQLDQGQISEAEFASSIRQMLRIAGAGRMLDGFSPGPFGRYAGASSGDPLKLTTDQQQQVRAVYRQLHDDIDTLRQQAHEQMFAILTPDQQARLNDLIPGSVPAGASAAAGIHGEAREVDGRFVYIADQLQLTSDQIAQIQQIRDDLQSAVQARHQQAHDDFRAILTADQQQTLDQLDATAGLVGGPRGRW